MHEGIKNFKMPGEKLAGPQFRIPPELKEAVYKEYDRRKEKSGVTWNEIFERLLSQWLGEPAPEYPWEGLKEPDMELLNRIAVMLRSRDMKDRAWARTIRDIVKNWEKR